MMDESAAVSGVAALTTGCGRRIVVGRMLVAVAAPIGRVTLQVGPDRDGGGAAWVSLTTAEARRLAGALLAQGKAVDVRQADGDSQA